VIAAFDRTRLEQDIADAERALVEAIRSDPVW